MRRRDHLARRVRPPRPARTPMRFDPSTVQRLHRALLARGEKLATLLSEVLAGKNAIPALTSAGIDLRPGEREAHQH